MDFALSEEQDRNFRHGPRLRGGRDRAPCAGLGQGRRDPKGLWPKLAELGFGALYVSEEHGGSGLTRLDATLVFEALSMACPSVAAFLSIHNMCARMIESYARTR
jgi:alkylation response protein AidB-like acyl-CoA dehydrogenase